MSVIKVDNLFKDFKIKLKGSGLSGSLKSMFKPEYKSIVAVDNISFEVPKGELLAFIGPNGAGKSTTIKMLTGILFPSSGQVDIFGLTPWKHRQKLSFKIGSVFGQKSQLWYHLPPLDSFELLGAIYEIQGDKLKSRIKYLTEIFELEELLTTPVRKLSLGQRMRCEIAGSLIHNPEVLFLDEPTIGLDVVVKLKIRDLIKDLNKKEGLTIFLTSHDAGDVEDLCKRVIVVNHGKTILDTSVSKLKRHFLNYKIIGAKIAGEVPVTEWEGVEVIKHTVHGIKFKVNTEIIKIEDVISRLMSVGEVIDINITDPPLEEVITAIYQNQDSIEWDEEQSAYK